MRYLNNIGGGIYLISGDKESDSHKKTITDNIFLDINRKQIFSIETGYGGESLNSDGIVIQYGIYGGSTIEYDIDSCIQGD